MVKKFKILNLVVLFISLISFSTNGYSKSKFMKINSKGEANFIFASQQIEKGKEHKSRLKKSFTKNDKIYARGYFPKRIGSCRNGEGVYVEMWIDGKRKFTGDYSKVNSSWDQMSIYLRNTGDDDFKSALKKELDHVSNGKHKVKLYFYRTKFTGYKKKINDNGKIVKIKTYKSIYLTKGEFTYIK